MFYRLNNMNKDFTFKRKEISMALMESRTCEFREFTIRVDKTFWM